MNPEELRKKLKKGSFSENEPMNLHTTFRAGGPARYYAVPCNEEELLFLLQKPGFILHLFMRQKVELQILQD